MKAREHKFAKLFVGMLTGDISFFENAEKNLNILGEIEIESEIYPWKYSDYYRDELGNNILRKFIGFKELIHPVILPDIKIKTIEIEKQFSEQGKRKINLDPGYLTLSKIVLASTKDYSHRVYIRDNIYAEVTLFYKNRKFNPFPWTYPDYRSIEYIKFFEELRNRLKSERIKEK